MERMVDFLKGEGGDALEFKSGSDYKQDVFAVRVDLHPGN